LFPPDRFSKIDLTLENPSASSLRENGEYFRKVYYNYKRGSWANDMDIKEQMAVPIHYQLDQLHQAGGYVSCLDQFMYQVNLYIPSEIADNYAQVYVKLNLFVEKYPGYKRSVDWRRSCY